MDGSATEGGSHPKKSQNSEHRVCADFLAAFFINESQAIDLLVSIIESKAMESRY